MEDAFGTLVWVVAGVGAVVALYTLIGTGRSYREIGGRGIVRDGDERVVDGPPRSTEAELREEIRDHVVAHTARRGRSGDAPLDVEQEIERRIRELS